MQPLNVLRIALKELKTFRDPKILVFMLATPLLLMFILGTVLSNAFNSSAEINEIQLLAQLETSDSMIQESWESFVRETEQAGIVFEQAGSYETAVQDVQNGRYTGYVTISSDGMEYYGSDRSELESSIVKGMLTAFAMGYNLETVITVDDAATQSIDNAMNYVEEVSLHADRQPGAMDYYAITMTTLIILFSALTAGQLMESERKRNTAMRLLAAPVTRLQIFIGKIAGTFFLNALFVIIIVFFSSMMFEAYWGERLAVVFAVLFSQILFALSLGIGLGYLLQGGASGVVLMIIVQLEAFFGGAYFAIQDAGGFLGVLANMSPLGWTNQGIFQLIYTEASSAANQAMLFNICGAASLLVATTYLLRRREGL
ncbi:MULTISPECIES: ABC transporter permease [Shouchella]|uniref:ABC transporter permease n=1 Tax=Shouchella TaxID=2893057 RepID=UPI001FCA050B|nr:MULTISPECIES: ABC transporter permease [Shouchella]MDO7282653.1 ABC transporter permease [Shouchella clausii]MDO7302750.1 ABC transporter permease [Shouchella clausii]